MSNNQEQTTVNYEDEIAQRLKQRLRINPRRVLILALCGVLAYAVLYLFFAMAKGAGFAREYLVETLVFALITEAFGYLAYYCLQAFYIIPGEIDAEKSQALKKMENLVDQETRATPIDVTFEAPFSYRGPIVYRFSVINNESQTLTNCYAKITGVTEVHKGEFFIVPQLHPFNWYSKRILWEMNTEEMDLRRSDPSYLSVLELGRDHFRFLFQGDTALADGEFEPIGLDRKQHTWLSHHSHILEITLFGDDHQGKSFEIKQEFALKFKTSGIQRLEFSGTRPYLDGTKPASTCMMAIKKITTPITSPEILERYFPI